MDYKGFDIEIEQDTDPESPRDWDNLGTMWCYHPDYRLGDWKNAPRRDRLNDELITLQREDLIALQIPLYLYDHGGLDISTKPYSSSWDSGHVGYIFVTRQKVLDEFQGWKYITQKRLKKVKEILESEVASYATYLRGDVYGFTISRHGEYHDSCWGFYGYAFCLNEAKEVVDFLLKEEEDAKVLSAVQGFVRACRKDAINSMTFSMFI